MYSVCPTLKSTIIANVNSPTICFLRPKNKSGTTWTAISKK